MYDVKYAPFADSYIGMAHGDTYEHVKRWLKQRFTFVDTLFDYAPSYNNDILTIRANTTELMTLEIETYTPVYLHLSWYNGQMDKKKIDGKVSVEFSGKAQTATDQEVLIYGGSNVKSIKGIQSANPNRLILGSATKLTELDASNCPLLYEINMNKANLSPHEYLNKVNLSNCPLLEGNLRLNNSPLVQEINIKGTNITGMNLPSSIRNLQVLRLPNTITELTLNDAGMLHTLEFDEGVNLQSVSMINCNALENVTGLDLLQTPSITLNNSYNNVAELYFRDTTNLSLSNMTNLERVIFTPNNEYDTFELINVANAPDYKVTTFNCPKLSTFMTTAPYRESWMVDVEYTTEYMGQIRTILEYIQTDGTQYFTTNYTPNANTVVKADMHMTRETTFDYFFGSNLFKLQLMNDSTLISAAGMTLMPRKELADTRQTWIARSTLVDKDTEPLCIFCGFYRNEMETKFKGIGKLYSFKIYENEVLLHDYEPCLDNKGVVCLYDKVVDNFLYASDGVLIPGNIVKVIDDEYVEVPHRYHGDIQPNATFTANSIDISSTQFTDVKLLCTTDTNTLKLPTTVKNFYCDSSFDLDTDYLEDGEYDVVHGELVEPYTTDYEGEVVLKNVIIDELNETDPRWIQSEIDGNGVPMSGNEIEFITDFISVTPSTTFKIQARGTLYRCRLYEYDIDKTYIGLASSQVANESYTFTLSKNTRYVRPNCQRATSNSRGYKFIYEELRTPNLVPSSSDGSLIFSMYAPNNTVAPASGTWDLKGLEFDNFHTFGMNNDVAYGCTVKKDITDIKTSTSYYSANVSSDADAIKIMFDYKGHSVSSSNITNSHYLCNIYIRINGVAYDYDFYNKGMLLHDDNTIIQRFSMDTKTYQMEFYATKESLSISIYSNSVLIEQYNLVGIGVSTSLTTNHTSIKHTPTNVREQLISNPVLTSETKLPLTMPARYDDYNITIKNAHIFPTDYNTMLYPLLVNENNPIEGWLNYKDYKGEYLSWSFAFIKKSDKKVAIIQPKDELLNSYKYKYNAFYETDYEFDNPYEVARYTSSASGVLPTFNSEFTYTYDEMDNGDGTYTTKIYANSLDNLPTKISFQNLTSLLTVKNLNTANVINMGNMFNGCVALTEIKGIEKWDVSNVVDVDGIFKNCRSIISLDLTNWQLSNVNNYGIAQMFMGCSKLTEIKGVNNLLYSGNNINRIDDMFNNCSSLTTLDLSDWNTSKVTTMSGMFRDCKELTSLDLSGFDTSNVTNMYGMFYGCSSLTSLDVSGFDTKNVTNMDSMFFNCYTLTSLDVSGFDTSNVTVMINMFNNCRGLTSLDVSSFDTSKVTAMYGMFRDCRGLTSLDLSSFDVGAAFSTFELFRDCINLTSLDLSGFDTKNVTNMAEMFRGCSGLTSLDLSGFDTKNVTNMGAMFQDCSKLTSLDLSGFDTSNVTNMSSMFQSCTNLTTLDVSGFDTKNVINMASMFRYCNSIRTLSLDNFDTSKVTDMSYMFQSNPQLEALDLSAWNVDKVTNFREFITLCRKLISLNLSSWTLDKVNTIIPQLSVSPSTSTLYGSVVIDESTLPSGWVYKFNNILEIARYTANASGVVPTFNNGFTGYNVNEIDNNNNTYTVSIMTDSLDNLPTSISFSDKTGLLTVDKLNTKNVTNMYNMFYNCYNLTSLDLSSFNTSNVTNMDSMFYRCSGLTSLDLSGFDTSKVTNMTNMFRNCSKLTSLDLSGLDASKVTNMTNMFNGCSKLTSLYLSGFDTGEVTDMGSMFYYCSSLTSLDLSGFDTGNVTNMTSMFNGCSSLTSLDLSGFDTGNVTNMGEMFRGCSSLTSLDVSGFKTSNVTVMGSMFRTCTSLTSLDLSGLDASKVTDMGSMFYYCINLTSLDLSDFKANNVVTTYAMFQDCSKLTSLDLSGFDTSKATNMSSMFKGCSGLTLLDSMQNISLSLDLFVTKLDATSLLDVIDNLATVSTKQTLTLGATNLAKLTEDQIAIAVNKGWTVS